jgi:DNA transformation protein
MVASAAFAELLREHLAPLGPITLRRMFGKTGVFCEGVMLAMVSDDTVYVRLDDQDRASFKEAEASPLLSYQKGGRSIDLAFCQVPDRLIDEPDELLARARAALAAAHRVAATRRRSSG